MSEIFDKDTWETPQWIFNWLDSIYDFNIDLCASKENSKCDKYFDIEENALIQKWWDNGVYGAVGFCNPPYSKIAPWIKKAISETDNGFTTVMLIPAPNGENHYADVFGFARTITFITGRIAFYNPALNKAVSGNSRGSCVVEFAPKFQQIPVNIIHRNRDDLIKRYSEKIERCV